MAVIPASTSGGDATYTYAQLEELWENAGGSAALAPVMAAIAEAESGGNPNAYNASGASGLWQILGAVDPADQDSLFNPIVNAREAVLKYESQGLGAWTTYTSGVYEQFLQNNVKPTAGGTSGTGSTGATGSGTTLTVPATAGVSGSGGSVDLAAPIQDMGTLLHGAAEALNFMMDWFEPGQGYRIITVIVGVGAGAGAVKLYTSKSASKEKSAAFPAAILLTSVAFLCAYMAFRTWPVSVSNKAERPAVYAVQILTGQKPPAGPPLADNTDDIEVGLGVLATAYVVTKTASAITGLSGAAVVLDNLFTGIKGFLGIGGEAAEEGGA